MNRWLTYFIAGWLLFAAWPAAAQNTPAPPPAAPSAPAAANPQSAEDYFNLAKDRFRNGDLAGAERHVRTAIALKSRYTEAHYLLGRIKLYQSAQRNRLLIENQAADVAALPYDKSWKEGIPELQEAVSQFRTVVTLDPQGTDGWLALGVSLDNLGQKEEAINAYKQTINLDVMGHNARDAHNNLGLIYLSQEKYKEAKAEYEAALNIDPTFGAARLNLEKLKKKKPGIFK